MTTDEKRLTEHHWAFFFGLLSMIAVVLLIAIALYIFPHLFFGLHYDVHDYISHVIEWGENKLNMSRNAVVFLIYIGLIFLILLFTWIGRIANRSIDRDVLPHASIADEIKAEDESFDEVEWEDDSSFWPYFVKVFFMFLVGGAIIVSLHMWFKVQV